MRKCVMVVIHEDNLADIPSKLPSSAHVLPQPVSPGQADHHYLTLALVIWSMSGHIQPPGTSQRNYTKFILSDVR